MCLRLCVPDPGGVDAILKLEVGGVLVHAFTVSVVVLRPVQVVQNIVHQPSLALLFLNALVLMILLNH